MGTMGSGAREEGGRREEQRETHYATVLFLTVVATGASHLGAIISWPERQTDAGPSSTVTCAVDSSRLARSIMHSSALASVRPHRPGYKRAAKRACGTSVRPRACGHRP